MSFTPEQNAPFLPDYPTLDEATSSRQENDASTPHFNNETGELGIHRAGREMLGTNYVVPTEYQPVTLAGLNDIAAYVQSLLGENPELTEKQPVIDQAPTPELTPSPTVVIVVPTANVRASASTSANVIDTMSRGESVHLKDNHAPTTPVEWYEVELPNGTIGYIHNSVAEIQAPTATPDPNITTVETATAAPPTLDPLAGREPGATSTPQPPQIAEIGTPSPERNIDSTDGYLLPELARDTVTVYEVVLPNGTPTEIVIKANEDKFIANGRTLLGPSETSESDANRAVQGLVNILMADLPDNTLTMYGNALSGQRPITDEARLVNVLPFYETQFDFSKPLVIVWVADHKDVPGLYYFGFDGSTDPETGRVPERGTPGFAYLIDPNPNPSHNVIYVFISPENQLKLRYGYSIIGIPLTVIQSNIENEQLSNDEIRRKLIAGDEPWRTITDAVEPGFEELSKTLVPQT